MSGILYETREVGPGSKIGIITFNRPKVLNAMNTETVNEFAALLPEIDKDKSVRCLILTGAGRAFCAGGDIQEEVTKNAITGYAFGRNCDELLEKVERFRTPIIAAVNGYALGGGLEFALACDIRIASKKAFLGSPEITLAVIPGWGGTQRLPRLVGPSKAKQIMFTGEKVSAEECYRIGLVDELVEPEELMDKAIAMATAIAKWGPLAMQYLKTVIMEGMQCDQERGILYECAMFGHLYDTKDAKEAMNAFLEKRPARPFTGE